MARNDPFEADLHGLEPEKLVLLMRSLNERTMKLNEEGKTIRILKTKFVLPKDSPSKDRTIKLKSSLKRRRYRPKTCLM